MNVGDWCWSVCGERYGDTFPTREEALANAREEASEESSEESSVFIAQVGDVFTVSQAFRAVIDVGWLEEQAADWLSDNSGCEDADEKMVVPALAGQNLLHALKTTIRAWGIANGLDKGVWYEVTNPESQELEEA